MEYINKNTQTGEKYTERITVNRIKKIGGMRKEA